MNKQLELYTLMLKGAIADLDAEHKAYVDEASSAVDEVITSLLAGQEGEKRKLVAIGMVLGAVKNVKAFEEFL